ncbi:MAG: hypothetical protein ACYSUN_12070 [Planctomycetota bacterium]|jgi:hypothetical protein
MNYFAHGHQLVESPYLLAGTALPDWLGAADRRARLRRNRINGNGDERMRAVASGVLRHYDDDAWFHATEAFQRTWMELTRMVGGSFEGKAWFVAHVLLEMLLDRFLIEEMPEQLDAYYDAIDSLDPGWIEATAAKWTTQPPRGLATYVRAFQEYRFLYGYLSDDGLCARLDRVIARVKLPPLPADFLDHLPNARALIGERVEALLTEPE